MSDNHDAVRARARQMYLDSRGNISLREIARQVDRDPSRISRWKKADKWEQDLDLLKESDDDLKSGDLEKIEKTLATIDWYDAEKELTPEQTQAGLAFVFKMLLRKAIERSKEDWFAFTNYDQLHRFLELVMKEFHLSRDEPTDIVEHRDAAILPVDDVKAIKEGFRRLILISKDRESHFLPEPVIEVEVVGEESE